MLIKNARVYRNRMRAFMTGDILVTDGLIRKVGKIDAPDEPCYDAGGAYVVPGLLDVHTHGRVGFDFVSASPWEYGTMAADYARNGVTTVMPTLATAPLPQMIGATDALNRFTPRAGEASFCGVHWEGRYMNPLKKGAHAEHLLAEPNASELKAEALSRCRALHITAAFELDRDGSFAKTALALGATLGLGHTAATYAEAMAAIEGGAVSMTHLFNAMPPLHHRDGGAVCAGLVTPRVYCELICDGFHIAPEMVKLAFRMKGDHLTLITDSMEATDCADGEYAIAGMPVIVKDGKARTIDGAIAGSTLSLWDGVKNLQAFAGATLGEAVYAATAAPARQVGIYHEVGSIERGKRADLLLLDEACENVAKVMCGGKFLN